MSGSAIERPFRSGPRFTISTRTSSMVSVKYRRTNADAESTAPSTPPRALVAERRAGPPQRQQIAVQRVDGFVGLTLGEIELAARERPLVAGIVQSPVGRVVARCWETAAGIRHGRF